MPLVRGVVHRGLIEPAKAVDHRRLAQLCVMAAQCFAAGRIDDAVGYAETGSHRKRTFRPGPVQV